MYSVQIMFLLSFTGPSRWYRLNGLLLFLKLKMNCSGDGRTLSEAEWKQLRSDVGKLKTDLDTVEVGSEIPESAPSIA